MPGLCCFHRRIKKMLNKLDNRARFSMLALDYMQKSIRNCSISVWVLLLLALSLTWADAQTFDVQLWSDGVKRGEWTPALISMGDGNGYRIDDTSYNPVGSHIDLYNVTLDF